MKRVLIILSLAALITGTVFLCGGCTGGTTYKVDYCGQKEAYKNAKDTYRAGEKVEVYFYLIATDTDYSFYLDGKDIHPLYEEDKGYVISFTMPEHDVKLSFSSKNSMAFQQ